MMSEIEVAGKIRGEPIQAMYPRDSALLLFDEKGNERISILLEKDGNARISGVVQEEGPAVFQAWDSRGLVHHAHAAASSY